MWFIFKLNLLNFVKNKIVLVKLIDVVSLKKNI